MNEFETHDECMDGYFAHMATDSRTPSEASRDCHNANPLPGPGDVPAPSFNPSTATFPLPTATPKEQIDVNITVRQEPVHQPTSAYVEQPQPDPNPTGFHGGVTIIPVGLIAWIGWRLVRRVVTR